MEVENIAGNHRLGMEYAKIELVQIKLQILVNKIVFYIFRVILQLHNVLILELGKCVHYYKMIAKNIMVLLNKHVEQQLQL